MPERIQLSRKKGWRKPENTVVVSRPSKWGNPIRWPELREDYREPADCRKVTTELFRDGFLMGDWPSYPTEDEVVAGLRGKNLACWCPLDQPCHADVLLELANA
ncbi:hypothetical protein GCM10010910_01080 [Microbacterium nanhaiense]|uniref:DUF4326 domain-containing protein n=1 Tax=Microbacterium nanhaiense TaxID=1301026 RepID=A0ABQ2MWZ4_9MICO|nr:DUF4326 domain-containing protein [Microbacterium nanhaiense]GGO59054.1 hypothetical protein GCM10010910_01080 [Microbacterium nanhaiense]